MIKADVLTRVPQKWLRTGPGSVECTVDPIACPGLASCTGPQGGDADESLSTDLYSASVASHNAHHMGVDRSYFLALRLLGIGVSKQMMRDMVANCEICRRIDPAPVRWEGGSLGVVETWARLATEITHYNGAPYLTVVDCGPGRFAVWRKLRSESGAEVAGQLELIFQERGTPSSCYLTMGSASAVRLSRMSWPGGAYVSFSLVHIGPLETGWWSKTTGQSRGWPCVLSRMFVRWYFTITLPPMRVALFLWKL